MLKKLMLLFQILFLSVFLSAQSCVGDTNGEIELDDVNGNNCVVLINLGFEEGDFPWSGWIFDVMDQTIGFDIQGGPDNEEIDTSIPWPCDEEFCYTITFFGSGGITDTCYYVDTTCLLPISLPVELTSFSGEYNPKDKTNDLKWSTASEINNDYFLIERRTEEGLFETVGRVEGNGSTQLQSTYAFKDDRIKSVFNYYRLKQVDFDGKFEYSDIITVKSSLKQLQEAILLRSLESNSDRLLLIKQE